MLDGCWSFGGHCRLGRETDVNGRIKMVELAFSV